MAFSDLEKSVLERYVTSAEDPIYAIRNTVPPEMFGAFGSYFSRNPKDFREHLLDALYGTLDGGDGKIDNSEFTIKTGLDYALEKMMDPSVLLQVGLSKSQDFFRKWYGKYSHKSIANTVWIPMVANDVSQLFAKELAYEQLAFFIEQSTRFVKFDVENMFQDPDVMASEHKGNYLNALDTLASCYVEITDGIIDHYTKTIPFDSWLESQTDKVKKFSEKGQKNKYEREIKGKAFDSSRFLLPQATKTNIAWICDARSTEFDIAAWKNHPIREIRDSAELIEKHAGQIAPSLLKYTDPSDYYGDKLKDYNFDLPSVDSEPFEKGVDMISYDHDGLEKLVAHLIHRHNRGGTFREKYEEVIRMPFLEKINILRRITENRGSYDEWVEMDEEVDLVKLAFEVRTDIGAIRDWRRHQKWDRSEPLYTLDNGFMVPPVINEMGGESLNRFNQAMEVAHAAELKIRKQFPHAVQYVLPMATNHTITFSGGVDQLQYMLWTRSTPQGNFSYREDSFNIAEESVRAMPWILGYKVYPSGKDFLEIYAEAPLKNFLKLQTGDLKLHQ